jgi:hypothetical protein
MKIKRLLIFSVASNSFKPSNDGFIDVSQIADRSVLDVKPVKKDDQE